MSEKTTKKPVCEHIVVLNKEEDFVFCSKCGKRWGHNEKELVLPFHPPRPRERHPDIVPLPYKPLTDEKISPWDTNKIWCKLDKAFNAL